MDNDAIKIHIIDSANSSDIRIKNEPFEIWGKMKPAFANGQWRYEIEKFAACDKSEMCFPDEDYDFDAMSANSVFLGAYDGYRCIGLAVLQRAMFSYMYLVDLKVCKAYRSRGIGRMLIEKAKTVASENKYRGIYTQGQDNNLSACLFYLKCGFRIGGLDTDVYKGTSLEGTSDIVFYLDIDAEK